MMVADTDVLVDYLRGAAPFAARIEFELERGHLATTGVTAFELRQGARSERQRSAVSLLLDALNVLPLDTAGAAQAATVRRQLLDRGEDIGMAESLIAGTVMAHGGVLLTRNRPHFERIDGLKLGMPLEAR